MRRDSRLKATLEHLLGAGAVRLDEPLAPYTVWRIGGPAQMLVVADTAEALRQVVTAAWEAEVPCTVLGAGSNVLVSDEGVRGLVIVNRARKVALAGPVVWAESGASFSLLARQCAAGGLAGLEWAAGIPGTVGGAAFGNAGAWGGDVASVLIRATVLEPPGSVAIWQVNDFQYGYRTSVLKQQTRCDPAEGVIRRPVILDVVFQLKEGNREALETRIAEIAIRRRAIQPAGASCGSVFRNPPGDYAGRLIEAAGLKGRLAGGAEISPVHANFIVNQGRASAADVLALIKLAQESVLKTFGVALELEIELVGEWRA